MRERERERRRERERERGGKHTHVPLFFTPCRMELPEGPSLVVTRHTPYVLTVRLCSKFQQFFHCLHVAQTNCVLYRCIFIFIHYIDATVTDCEGVRDILPVSTLHIPEEGIYLFLRVASAPLIVKAIFFLVQNGLSCLHGYTNHRC